MSKKSRPLWFRLIRGLVVVYAGLCVFSCTLSDSLIFMPQRPSYAASATGLIRLETSKAKSIAAFHFPATAGKPTVLFSHGNAEDIGGSLPLYQQWRALGWGVLAYDYPGYGHSSGRPSESSCERAIDAAWKYLTENQGVRPADILIVGRSVGSGPSVWLADRVEPAGLVLISPFTSTFAVRAPAHLVLPGDRFPNLKRIRGIDHPLLVIHGEDDFLIPPSHGRDLVNASPAALKRFVGVPNAGHNDLGGSDIVAATRKFVREIHSLGAQD